MTGLLLLHGGVGSDRSRLDELNERLDGYASYGSSDDAPLDNVVNAVSRMEDDQDFNAGTGSVMRIDGTIQMDAAVMVPGDFGSVMGIEGVRHPIVIARAVMEMSPHIMLTGDGALKFARSLGHEYYDPSTEKARKRLDKVLEDLDSNDKAVSEGVLNFRRHVDYKRFLNDSCDTVGAVARQNGKFAAAVSTGGTSPMMRGRVGDSPVIGAGIYCGPEGAAVATGIGEEIAKKVLCYRVYARIGSAPLAEILKEEVEKFGQTLVGLIAVDKTDFAYYDNGSMSVGVKQLSE